MLNDSKFKFFIKKNSDQLQSILTINKKIHFSCIILDTRQNLSKSFVKYLTGLCKVIIVRNNPNHEKLRVDLLIWPDVQKEYPKNITLSKPAQILAGNRYVLLGNLKQNNIQRNTNQILISMGGTDKRNLTAKIIRALKKSNHIFHANIIIGKLFTKKENVNKLIKNDERFTIIENKNNLIPFMQKATLGIFTFGVTVYEALYCGLPCIVMSHSKENDLYAKKLNEYNCMNYLGYYKSVKFTSIQKIVFDTINNQKLLKALSNNGSKLIDGKGSYRASQAIKNIM